MTYSSLSDLVSQIHNGALIALPAEYSFVPMDMVRCLIAAQKKSLQLLCVPIGGMATDMLIGAGCIDTLEAAAVSLGEAGPAPRFSEAVVSKTITMKDATCPAIHSSLQAAEKGVPFMPLGGIIGSDLVTHRDDWQVIDDPLGKGNGRILLLPAIRPDFALFHAPLADREGNVWVGKRRELFTMAHAAKQSLVTVEEIREESLLEDDLYAAGTLPAMYISAIAQAQHGAWPLGITGLYDRDHDAIADYAKAARTQEGFDAWLDSHLDMCSKRAAE
jgi:glutaconate CoA-transferase, subunit A